MEKTVNIGNRGYRARFNKLRVPLCAHYTTHFSLSRVNAVAATKRCHRNYVPSFLALNEPILLVIPGAASTPSRGSLFTLSRGQLTQSMAQEECKVLNVNG